MDRSGGPSDIMTDGVLPVMRHLFPGPEREMTTTGGGSREDPEKRQKRRETREQSLSPSGLLTNHPRQVMFAKSSSIECQLIAGPFDGLTIEQAATTASIAVSLKQLTEAPAYNGWAIYARTEPDVLLDDGTIEFLYEGTSDKSFN
jgi:hypothetical protein